ncbi:CD99 molecule isoform X1 [Kryptolebias marmoratus]|uniref:CD99 molecule isoform X1 n=1 Tax=Kryptolebias marmoratus TaxID=37003 RepID=UPI0018ACC729|nr:CD99 molecule isoform X1 [Kryptolebias marmoratus]
MKFCLGTLLLLFLVPGSSTQDGFDLADAFDDVVTPPPKLQPKPPEKPKTDGELDLSDAFGPDDPATEKPKKPSSGGFDDFRFDLEDALKPDPNAKTDKPAIVPPKGGGGGGTFDDSDLFEVGAGDYKPDGGRSGIVILRDVKFTAEATVNYHEFSCISTNNWEEVKASRNFSLADSPSCPSFLISDPCSQLSNRIQVQDISLPIHGSSCSPAKSRPTASPISTLLRMLLWTPLPRPLRHHQVRVSGDDYPNLSPYFDHSSSQQFSAKSSSAGARAPKTSNQ